MTSDAIRLACVNLSFHRIIGVIIAELLGRRGYQVEIVEGTHEDLYPRLGAGEFDLLTAAWLPNGHGPLWAAHGEALEKLTPLYEGARFFLAVPDSVPRGQVGSLADLAKPQVSARMNKTIQALGPGAGLTRLAHVAVDVYGLADMGYVVRSGDGVDWRAALDEALQGEPYRALALWTPLFTDSLGIRPLDDPRGAFGAPDVAFLVAHHNWIAKLDETTAAKLRALRIPREDVSGMDAESVLSGSKLIDVARNWLDSTAKN